MEHKDPNVDKELDQLIEMMSANGASPEEINDAITSHIKTTKASADTAESGSNRAGRQSG